MDDPGKETGRGRDEPPSTATARPRDERIGGALIVIYLLASIALFAAAKLGAFGTKDQLDKTSFVLIGPLNFALYAADVPGSIDSIWAVVYIVLSGLLIGSIFIGTGTHSGCLTVGGWIGTAAVWFGSGWIAAILTEPLFFNQ